MNSQQAFAEFEASGFVRMPGFFSSEETDAIRSALNRYVTEIAPQVPPADRVLEADGASVRNLWRMQHHSPFFAELAERPRILELVSLLVRGRAVLMAVESFCKPARVGSAVPYHQDNAYFCQSPPDVLTLWVAVDRTDQANGAVYYVPGSHRELLPHAPSGVQGNSIGLLRPPAPGTPEVCAVLEPGDVVFHHCQTIHRSGPNSSDKPRRGLLLVYRGEQTQTDPVLKSQYEAALAQLAGSKA